MAKKTPKTFDDAHYFREAMRYAVEKLCPHGVDSKWKRTGGSKCKSALKLLDMAEKRMAKAVKKTIKKKGK